MSIMEMMDVKTNFIRTRKWMMDPYGATFVTAKACPVLQQHLKFVKNKINFIGLLALRVDGFAKQV